jgi:hypothetical protein
MPAHRLNFIRAILYQAEDKIRPSRRALNVHYKSKSQGQFSKPCLGMVIILSPMRLNGMSLAARLQPEA